MATNINDHVRRKNTTPSAIIAIIIVAILAYIAYAAYHNYRYSSTTPAEKTGSTDTTTPATTNP